MRIAALKESFCESQLDEVLAGCGFAGEKTEVFEHMADVDLDSTDLLILSMDVCNVFGALNGSNTGEVPDFVRRGGLCWVLHQEREGWDATWLPEELRRNLRVDLKHLPKMVAFRSNAPARSAYIGPWMTEPFHQLFQKPNFLDESDFAEWSVEAGGKAFKTAAINAITRHEGWKALAAYEDMRTPLKDGALVMEARFGEGLYLWTQTLSPSFVWRMEGSREKLAWRKLVQNALRYFMDFKERKELSLRVKVTPWSVMLGESVEISVELPPGAIASKVRLYAGADGAEEAKGGEVAFATDGRALSVSYSPDSPGNSRLSVEVETADGRSGRATAFVKATGERTPFRFTTHHHYRNDWVTEHLGQVYGSARLWNLDALFLASGLFYQPRDMYLTLGEGDLKLCDRPSLRIFPGQETHPHHQYGLDEGNTDVSKDSRRHIATMGCGTLICDANLFESDTVSRIHEAGGLAIVAHPNPGDPWWRKAWNGHRCDGVCLDTGDFARWDEALLNNGSPLLFPAVRGSDSGPGEWSGGQANTAWLREPLSMRALMKAAVNGRISFLYPKPGDFSTTSSTLWFDMEGQRMGGSVWAASSVSLNVEIDSHSLVETFSVVRNGARGAILHRFGARKGRAAFEVPVEEDCYFRIEAFGAGRAPDADPKTPEGMPAAWSNPIFARKIEAPEGAWIFFDKDPDFSFDAALGRFAPNPQRVERSSVEGSRWMLELFDAEPQSSLRVFCPGMKSLRLDGELKSRAPGGTPVALKTSGGSRRLEIEFETRTRPV